MNRILMAMLVLTVSAVAVQIKEKAHVMETPARSADSVLSEADTLFQQNDYTAAFTAYEEAYKLAQAEFNRSVETEALSQMARVKLRQGNKEEGRQWLAKAGERADEVDPMGWSRYLGVKGRFEWQDDDLTAARATFEQMYEYCVANALWSRAVDAAHMVAIVAAPFEDQVRWGRRGIEMAEKAETESWLGPLWNNLAGSYFDHGDYDSALACYRRAREYHWRFSGETAKLFADYHVGMTLRKLGRYDEAASWLRPVLAWAERLGDHSAIGQACEDLGEIEIVKGNKAAGVKLLRRARDEYKAAGFDTTWTDIWEHINKRLKEVE